VNSKNQFKYYPPLIPTPWPNKQNKRGASLIHSLGGKKATRKEEKLLQFSIGSVTITDLRTIMNWTKTK
jgi:hypothetical protein